MEIDLNCDLGEDCGNDAEVMPLVSSANICCGFHAGDPESAYAALRLAREHDVAAGAHPGFADREHFGRLELNLPPDVIFRLCVHQVGALLGLARAAGDPLRFIKPHGALYNMACRDDAIARPVIAAAELFELPLVGLPDSALERGCLHMPFVREGFADRRYLPDGSLTPRARANAFIVDVDEAVSQAQWLMKERRVQTLCVHGDNPRAVEFVRRLREEFERRGIPIRACT